MSLEKIIRPIVEGQIKAFMDAHPDGERYPGHLISGIGKRITHDICSTQTVERIKLALGAGLGGDAGNAEGQKTPILPSIDGEGKASPSSEPPLTFGIGGGSC